MKTSDRRVGSSVTFIFFAAAHQSSNLPRSLVVDDRDRGRLGWARRAADRGRDSKFFAEGPRFKIKGRSGKRPALYSSSLSTAFAPHALALETRLSPAIEEVPHRVYRAPNCIICNVYRVIEKARISGT